MLLSECRGDEVVTDRLDGRVAIVTGASQGLGASIARAYVRAGASVVVCARDAALLEQRRQELQALTGADNQRVLAVESPEFSAPPAGVDERFWGPLAGVMVKEYAAKQPRYAAAREALSQGGRWDRLRQQLSAMLRPPAVIAAVLGGAGAACRAADIGCDRPRLLAAFLHAHEIRSRFTVLDLAYLLGLLPGDLVEIVDQWG